MAKQPIEGSLRSSVSSKKRSDGKLRYETTIPIKVATEKGIWKVKITNDNKIYWDKLKGEN